MTPAQVKGEQTTKRRSQIGVQGSQWTRTRSTPDRVSTGQGLILDTSSGVGLIGRQDRVFEVDEFRDAARRVAAGGSALDPKVVAALVAAQE